MTAATAAAAPLTARQIWALALRQGMLTDGWTMDDVRARYAVLLDQHGVEDGRLVAR